VHVLATAGHVDHGKSTLVRALTGMEPDRWAEERRRGMTIDLGFAWTTLPTGEQLAFVDVPGHERFVPNMLAGVGPVPAALVVVAADEGWAQQSEEHLAALDALGVAHGLLAVTRSDLADPVAATEQALARLATSSLGAVEAVTVSGSTGAGLPELAGALSRLVRRLPPPDTDADVRLWVDRAFTVRGRGTVVTGTLGAGTLRVGDEVELAPGGRVAAVRGLQSLQVPRDVAPAVARVAVNLRGVDVGDVGRGAALLTPGRWLPATTLDVRLRGDAPDQLPRELILHVGSAAATARVRHLGADVARLGLAAPLPLRIGDRALLRDPGRHRVVAGVVVLDVRPPALHRRGAAAARADQLGAVTGRPDGGEELARRGIIRREELRAMGAQPPEGPAGEPRAGTWLVDPVRWDTLVQAATGAVERYAAAHPTEPGMPLEVARRALDLPDVRLAEAVAAAAGLVLEGGRAYGARRRPELPPALLAAVEAVRADLARAPFAAPDAGRLAELGLSPRALAAAVAAGELVRLADGVYLAPGFASTATRLIATLPQPFTVSQARQALGTTRRVVVPLLETLDAQGWTTREDDVHRRVRAPHT